MNKITSVLNEKIKEAAKLLQTKYRNQSDYFLVEGQKSLQEIVESNIKIIDIFVQEGQEHLIKIDLPFNSCSFNVMKKLSSTASSPSVIVVAKKNTYPISSFLQFDTIALIEGIKDPGNLGTIIRSAAAFGINAIILIGETVDIFNPKVIRSAAGNFFKVPVIKFDSISQVKTELSEFRLVTTAIHEKDNISAEEIISGKSILCFGSEAQGLSDAVISSAKSNYIIPMNSSVESLNLSVAASIAFYELYKARN